MFRSERTGEDAHSERGQLRVQRGVAPTGDSDDAAHHVLPAAQTHPTSDILHFRSAGGRPALLRIHVHIRPALHH